MLFVTRPVRLTRTYHEKLRGTTLRGTTITVRRAVIVVVGSSNKVRSPRRTDWPESESRFQPQGRLSATDLQLTVEISSEFLIGSWTRDPAGDYRGRITRCKTVSALVAACALVFSPL
jgi:hypothetical protein